MKLKQLIPHVASAFILLNAGSALAADWGGIYAGTAASSNTGDYHVFAVGPNFVGPTEYISGNMGSAFVGYNFDAGQIVYGIEVATTVYGTAPSTTPLSTDYLSSVTDIKARVGYEVGNALIYGVVGNSSGNFEVLSTMTAVSGMSYGVGIDFLITPSTFIGIEYLERSMTGVVAWPDEVDVNVDSISIRAGILF